MRAAFIDCPPFLKELYDAGLDRIVPDLEVHVGSPDGDGESRELAVWDLRKRPAAHLSGPAPAALPD